MMILLSELSDKQNLLLTQLSYESDVLKDNYNGMTLKDILGEITDTGARKTLQALCDAGLGDLRIKDVGNDPVTGFGAVAFTDDAGNTGFSFRGTDGISLKSINDWVDNVTALLTGTSMQTAQAESFFDMNKNASGNNYLYGHSKGGELAESVFVNNYSDIKKVSLLNPQPINPYALSPDQLKAIQSDKVDIVIVEGDYVWFLGSLPSYGNIRIIKSNGKNPHLYESIYDMYDEEGNLISGDMPWWEYAAYFFISVATFGFQFIGGAIGFVYNCVTRIVDFVIRDLIQNAKDFIAWVSDTLEKIGNDIKDFIVDLKNFLSSTIDKVRNWYNNNLNYGYKYATSNPRVVVDTYKLKEYAQRLWTVNSRIGKLDGRLDSLYWEVGLLDLWDLMKADLLTGYSWRLQRAATYLNDTAFDFERAETELSGI